jgi:uncharacterized protein YeaO (DUF488 family)
MHQPGLSMALGAFMMGMLLSESRYSLSGLDDHPEEVSRLLEILGTERLTLVCSARDDKFNNAVALREYIGARIDI